MWDEIANTFPTSMVQPFRVWHGQNHHIPPFSGHVIAYLHTDYSSFVLIKRAPGYVDLQLLLTEIFNEQVLCICIWTWAGICKELILRDWI